MDYLLLIEKFCAVRYPVRGNTPRQDWIKKAVRLAEE